MTKADMKYLVYHHDDLTMKRIKDARDHDKTVWDKLETSLYRLKMQDAIDDLPQFRDEFDENSQENWLHDHVEYLPNVKQRLSDNLTLKIEGSKLLKVLNNIVYMKLDKTVVVKGSSEYYELIAKAQEDLDERGFRILDAFGIEPVVNPFDIDVDTSCLVGDMFPTNGIGELFGKTTHFKTFFMIDLAFCIAHGLKFHGEDIEQGLVIYVAAEDINGVVNRFRALSDYYGVSIDRENLKIIRPTELDLLDENSMEYIESKLRTYNKKAKLMVVDTLVKAAKGFDLVNASGWSTIVANLEKYVMPHVGNVCCITHPSKRVSDEPAGTGTRINGADYVYKLERESSTSMTTNLSCVKNKNGVHFKDRVFKFKLDAGYNTLVPA